MNDNLTFVSTYVNYEKEEDGRKCNTVRPLSGMTHGEMELVREWMRTGKFGTVAIMRGCSSRRFTRQITDITIWDMHVIISWSPSANVKQGAFS